LRIEAEFHHSDELAGLIWESEDRLDHPLLAYATDRDYARTTLRFRWRSGGILPLDAPNGPTLTIEGRDGNGAPRSWYVRLWNYAVGTPEDAQIVLPFSALSGGWDIADNPDPVHPAAIDRLFISLSPPGYDPVLSPGEALSARVDGWLELSDIRCEGDRPMLAIGDVLLPPHGVQMATAYDDCYNQAPARILRSIRGLGYRGRIVHYLGMSHFFRLVPDNGALLADPAGMICNPAAAWHTSFFALCAAQGQDVIASLSYELFAAHCPDAWQQRSHDGQPARTGWDPPSALLSPANEQAMGWLRSVAARFVAMQRAAGLPVLFQIGEPWWWVTANGRICLYDDAARAAFGGNPVAISDMRAPLDPAQLALLDQAGALLAQSTGDLAQAVRAAAGPAEAEVLLLAFTPTILDPAMPDLRRANMPEAWAWPAFDRLQLEDYDWLTAGAEALRNRAYRTVQARLNYPLERQDYLAGFVLAADDADAFWRRIDAGLDEAALRGVSQRFVWALQQISRDGYTRLAPSDGGDMQAFDDLLYPLTLGRDAGVSPEFSTSVVVTASGHERRSSLWSDARLRFDAGPGIRSEEELGTLIAFFRARRGAARGFRIADPYDCSSNNMTGTPTMLDQRIGMGDGLTASFRLVKT
ncbi:MAG: TIGR02217 family protein, partial [Oxalobacteraceae bacterium]